MSQDLLANETHATDYQGSLIVRTVIPKDGDEIENFQAGQMYYNSTNKVLYIFNGTTWYGKLTVAM